MPSTIETARNGARVETGTLEFGGQEFSALGSVVDEEAGLLIGYPNGAALQTWDGKPVEGVRLEIVSSWPVRSWQAPRRYAYRVMYKGRAYHGRGFGDGMLLRLRASGRRAGK